MFARIQKDRLPFDVIRNMWNKIFKIYGHHALSVFIKVIWVVLNYYIVCMCIHRGWEKEVLQ